MTQECDFCMQIKQPLNRENDACFKLSFSKNYGEESLASLSIASNMHIKIAYQIS